MVAAKPAVVCQSLGERGRLLLVPRRGRGIEWKSDPSEPALRTPAHQLDRPGRDCKQSPDHHGNPNGISCKLDLIDEILVPQ